MHRDCASNDDMLMRTQCTICLSSDHSERRPQRHLYHSPFSTSLSLLPSLPRLPPPVSSPSLQRGSSDGAWLGSLYACCFPATPFSPRLLSSQTFRSPKANSFPPSFLPLFFISCLLTPSPAMKNREVLTSMQPLLYFLVFVPTLN